MRHREGIWSARTGQVRLDTWAGWPEGGDRGEDDGCLLSDLGLLVNGLEERRDTGAKGPSARAECDGEDQTP